MECNEPVIGFTEDRRRKRQIEKEVMANRQAAGQCDRSPIDIRYEHREHDEEVHVIVAMPGARCGIDHQGGRRRACGRNNQTRRHPAAKIPCGRCSDCRGDGHDDADSGDRNVIGCRNCHDDRDVQPQGACEKA